MADQSEFNNESIRQRMRRPGFSGNSWLTNPMLRIPLMLIGLAAMATGYVWFGQRIDVGPDEVLVLVRRIGDSLPADKAGDQVVLYPELLASLGEKSDSHKYKGIVLEPKLSGWHFYDPFLWDRKVFKREHISEGEIGVMVRKFGRPLPPGQVVATKPDERGPLPDVLKPGDYPINKFAYEIKRVKPTVIPAGFVGVQTLLTGPEPKDPNRYVVERGERGVQPDAIDPGTDFNNPYVRKVDLIDVRSHTIDLAHENEIRFPSNDSFTIAIDFSIEYAVRKELAPYVMVAIGDHDDIKDKLIRPFVSSFARIEGSKMLAREFISGDMRTTLQERIVTGLRKECYEQGIEIRSVNVRNIAPPQEIAGPISDRQLADQQIKRFESEIKVAESQSKLVEQEEMQKQNQALGQAQREVVSVVKEAEQSASVAITLANQKLEVAKKNLEAAKEKAAKTLALGKAEADVLRSQFEARTKPLREAIAAFGTGDEYAQFFFFEKLAPSIKSVLASTDGPFAEIFKSLSIAGGAKSGEKKGPSPTSAPATSGGAAVARPNDAEGGQR